MIENQNNPDIVDTTDNFEAASVINGKKRLFFAIIFLCLLLTQTVFWVNHLDAVDRDNYPCDCCQKHAGTCTHSDDLSEPMPESPPPTDTSSVQSQSSDTAANIEAAAQTAAAQAEDDLSKLQTELKQTAAEITGQADTENSTALPEAILSEHSAPADQADDDVAASSKGSIFPKPNCYILASVIKVCNFVLIIISTLYVLTLLIAIKISLTGRLGGLEHITKAFFASLFMLLIILPWQKMFPGIVVGMIYTPHELFSAYNGCSNEPSGFIAQILYYLRFCGTWLLVVISLLKAQSSSGKWAKTVQRRLGMLH